MRGESKHAGPRASKTRIELAAGAFCDLYRGFLAPAAARRAMEALRAEVPWERRAIELYGRKVLQPRLVAFVGDATAVYTYSRTRHLPAPWTPTLAELRGQVERATGARFNSVLCNLYRDGQDSMGMHSDAEPELGPNPVVASLSLGATRRFCLRQVLIARGPARFDRDKRGAAHWNLDLALEAGSLLVMGGTIQHVYRHGVPRQPAVSDARINLTFRWVNPIAGGRRAT
jgi:alkylated DNA repair dioxygenase AlkB